MEKKKYVVTYTEHDTINKKVEIEAISKELAVIAFQLTHPNAVHESIEEVK